MVTFHDHILSFLPQNIGRVAGNGGTRVKISIKDSEDRVIRRILVKLNRSPKRSCTNSFAVTNTLSPEILLNMTRPLSCGTNNVFNFHPHDILRCHVVLHCKLKTMWLPTIHTMITTGSLHVTAIRHGAGRGEKFRTWHPQTYRKIAPSLYAHASCVTHEKLKCLFQMSTAYY